jgi:hypothetical protein
MKGGMVLIVVVWYWSCAVALTSRVGIKLSGKDSSLWALDGIPLPDGLQDDIISCHAL